MCININSIKSELRERLHRSIEIDQVSGCWIWTGSKINSTTTVNGRYGQIVISYMSDEVQEFFKYHYGTTRVVVAHRMSYLAYNGMIPAGKNIIHNHSCPKECCNPAHLVTGTSQENRSDYLLGLKRLGKPVKSRLFTSKEQMVVISGLFNNETNYAIAKKLNARSSSIDRYRKAYNILFKRLINNNLTKAETKKVNKYSKLFKKQFPNGIPSGQSKPLMNKAINDSDPFINKLLTVITETDNSDLQEDLIKVILSHSNS